MMMAWKLSGLSHSPAIIASRPASMRLAIAISPSRDKRFTDPISRRYMRTGSSVRSAGSLAWALAGTVRWTSTSSPLLLSDSSSGLSTTPSSSVASAAFTTFTPISLNIARTFSTCSESSSFDRTSTCSWVT